MAAGSCPAARRSPRSVATIGISLVLSGTRRWARTTGGQPSVAWVAAASRCGPGGPPLLAPRTLLPSTATARRPAPAVPRPAAVRAARAASTRRRPGWSRPGGSSPRLPAAWERPPARSTGPARRPAPAAAPGRRSPPTARRRSGTRTRRSRAPSPAHPARTPTGEISRLLRTQPLRGPCAVWRSLRARSVTACLQYHGAGNFG